MNKPEISNNDLFQGPNKIEEPRTTDLRFLYSVMPMTKKKLGVVSTLSLDIAPVISFRPS